jgi:type I restriction enzyme M protein
VFIDASKGFEKAGNQNYLRQPHVDKIIDSYRHHRAEPKHSYIATVAVVALNDYNLNIPRYVDTFEKEKAVDLSAIAVELESLESEIKLQMPPSPAFAKS